MRGILLEVSQQDLARRRRLGLDRWDEMWEGVLHMAPAPAFEHQRIQLEVGTFLLLLSRPLGHGTVAAQVNVFSASSPGDDYRIPDFAFVALGRERVLAPDGIRGGPPDVVIEIRSPGDETYEKFHFFARLGVQEVLVIDRDTKQPEVHRLAEGSYEKLGPDEEGWLVCAALRVRLRLGRGGSGLRVEDVSDPGFFAVI